MNANEYWTRAQEACEARLPRGENTKEYLINAKFGARNTNRIQFFERQLKRLSDGPKSKWRTISKENFLWFAEEAINCGSEGFPIEETIERGGPSHMGSIVCAILDLLDEFEYRNPPKGREFVFVGQKM